MCSRTTALYVMGIAVVVGSGAAQPAAALTMQQCSAKYKVVKTSARRRDDVAAVSQGQLWAWKRLPWRQHRPEPAPRL